MSVQFEIRTRIRRLGKVDDVVLQWVTADVPISFDQVGAEYGWVFAPGLSVRGFSVRRERQFLGDRFRIRLNVAASRGDWGMAFAMLHHAAMTGARVFGDDGCPLAADQLSATAAERLSREQFARDVRVLRQIALQDSDAPIRLPNPRFSLSLTLDDLPTERMSAETLQSFEDSLVARTLKYRGVRVAATITLNSGKTAVVWSGESLIIPEVNFVVFPGTLETPDIDDYVHKDLSQVLETIGDRAEYVDGESPWYFLREFSPERREDADLWQLLCRNAQPIDKR